MSMSTTTTVITNQASSVIAAPSMSIRGKQPREWTTALMDCFDDIPSCLVAFYCPCFMECWLAYAADEFICMPLCVPGAMIAIRTKIRTKHNIRGSVCNDCLVLYYCAPCALAQVKREIDFTRQAHNANIV